MGLTKKAPAVSQGLPLALDEMKKTNQALVWVGNVYPIKRFFFIFLFFIFYFYFLFLFYFYFLFINYDE